MAESPGSPSPLLTRRKPSSWETEQLAQGHTQLGSGPAEPTGADPTAFLTTSHPSWGPGSLGNYQRPLLPSFLLCALTLSDKLVRPLCRVSGLKRVGEKWQSGKWAWLSPLSLRPISQLQIPCKRPAAFKKSLGFKHTQVWAGIYFNEQVQNAPHPGFCHLKIRMEAMSRSSGTPEK